MVRLLNVAGEDPDMVLLVPLSLTVDELTTKVALLTQFPPILTLPVAESVPPEIVRSPSKVVVLFRDRVPAPVLVRLPVPDIVLVIVVLYAPPMVRGPLAVIPTV